MNTLILVIIAILITGTLMATEQSTDQAQERLKSAHQFFAVNCNNKTWELMDSKEFTPEQKDALLQNAFASAYHWSKVGTGVNFQRGEWLIARVYTILGNAQESLAHAMRCQELTTQYKSELQDFDIAYSYEALARAYALNKDKENFQKYKDLANTAGEQIANKEDKDQFMLDLKGAIGLR